MAPAQAVKTLIHELAHALLHSEGPVASREIAEVEVESVAFIVCEALGLDSGEYSFPYVTRWAEGDVEMVKTAAERAIVCGKAILERLEASWERIPDGRNLSVLPSSLDIWIPSLNWSLRVGLI